MFVMMEENIKWYREKELDRLSSVLLDKGYLIYRVFSIEDAKKKILSLLSEDKTIALGDGWDLVDDEFINNLRKYKLFDRFNNINKLDENIKRESLLSNIAIVEGELITESGEIFVVGDYNTSLSLFGAEKLILLVSANKIVKDSKDGFSKIESMNKYYRMRSDRLNNVNDGLSIGLIENGKKFPNRITVIICDEDSGIY